MNFLLVGAGGHARAVVEAVRAQGGVIVAYVDHVVADWLDAERFDADYPDTSTLGELACAFGLGGVQVAQLKRRMDLVRRYGEREYKLPTVVHPAAHVSAGAQLEDGCTVLAGAVIQPATKIGTGAIVNTGAIVEHDSVIGDGAHVAPGAVVLGGCTVGAYAMVGASAVVLAGAAVPPGGLVDATGRYPR